MAAKPLPDQATLLKLLRYDLETGKLFWRERPVSVFRAARNKSAAAVALTWNKRFAGHEALVNIDTDGYRRGGIAGKLILAHRVIWKMITGDDPDFIDHINGDRTDNRFCNLRSITKAENNRNASISKSNTSGCRGVSWNSADKCWVVRLGGDSSRKYLGRFRDKTDAVRARKAAERQNGFHPNHGRAK